MTANIRIPRAPLSIRQLSACLPIWQQRGADILELPEQSDPRYLVGFAASERSIEQALRLRYRVFNLELGEGYAASHLTGLDEDLYDKQMTHLVLVHRETGSVVGNYRLQTARHGLANKGIYSATEFDLSQLEPYFDEAVELGRVCIDEDHRCLSNLFLLWSGVWTFVKMHAQRWLFGCISINTADPDDGWRSLKTLRSREFLHEELFLPAQPAMSCGHLMREFDPTLGPAIKLPKLFSAYARLGAKVISEPALDREFGSVDFLILMDASEVKVPGIAHR